MRYLLVSLSALVALGLAACAPNFDRAKQAANEAAAVNAIKTLHTAQVQYSSMYDHFAKSLAELGPPSSGAPSESAADLISADLASGQKFGFKFALSGDGKDYQILVVPVSYNVTGSRTFYSDKTMVVHQNKGPEPATASSPELGQ